MKKKRFYSMNHDGSVSLRDGYSIILEGSPEDVWELPPTEFGVYHAGRGCWEVIDLATGLSAFDSPNQKEIPFWWNTAGRRRRVPPTTTIRAAYANLVMNPKMESTYKPMCERFSAAVEARRMEEE